MLDKSNFEKLENMLNRITIPLTSKTNNRRGFPKHRRAIFGLVKQRYTGKIDISRFSKKYPEINNELFRIGKDVLKFNFTSIYINKDVICPAHKDEKNIGESLIISIGKYEGCKLVIEGQEFNSHYNPVIFNGSEKEHWTTDDLVGSKFSLIYFNIM